MVLLAAELPPPAAGAEEVRRAVADVLSRPEYADLTPSLAERARAWAAEQLGRLLEAVVGTGQAALIGSLVLAAVLAVVVVLAVRFARGVRADPVRVRPGGDRVGRDAADWAAEADAHERAGRRREAVRCRYRMLVAALAAAGAVEEAPGRTTGEYLAETVQRRPDLADDVAAVTRAFEAAWYGSTPVDEALLDDVRRRADAAAAAARLRPQGRSVVAAGGRP